MTQKFIFFLLLFAGIQVFSQKTISTKKVVKSVDTQFSIEKVFNKRTGEKISAEEFSKLISKNPNLSLDRVYDNSGNVVKYLYDPDKKNSPMLNSSKKESKAKGEKFPNLNLTTIDGETIKIEDLKGKLVIIRMEMEAGSFRFKKHEIEELDEAINQTGRESEIEAIAIFRTSELDVRKGFDLKNSNFKAIPNGANFQNQLNIRSFPTTIVLDKEGRVIDNFRSSNRIDILELLNES